MADLSAFDPDAFASATTNEASDTKYQNVPGADYVAMIDKVEVRKTDPTERNPAGQVVADVIWAIDDPKLQAEFGRDKITVKQGLFLDVVERNGKIELDFGKGKNVPLGKVRDAVGMNESGRAFNLKQLEGAGPARIKVVVTPSKTSDEMYSNVKSVGRM